MTLDYELTVRDDDGEVVTVARGTTDSPEGLYEVVDELERALGIEVEEARDADDS